MMDYRERIHLLMKLRDVVRLHEKAIYQALKDDLGKPEFEAYESEIGMILTELNYVIKYLSSWMKYKTVPTPYFYMPAVSMIYREPFGKVLILSPWNDPFAFSLIPLINAWSAGNTVTLCPSEIAGNSARLLYDMLTKNFHTSRVRVMLGDKDDRMHLLEKKFDYIFFTGNKADGKVVMQKAAEQMTPVFLQIAGKTPCLLDEECNLKAAAKKIVRGKFMNCGQSSMAPDFILVSETNRDRLLGYIENYITKFYGDDPLQSPDYGRIINLENFFRLLDLIEHQEIVIGGDFDTCTMKIVPTVVIETSLCSDMMKSEIMGPILPIITYRTWEEAVDRVMRFQKSPALYFFTKNKNHEEFIKNHFTAGSICINDTIVQAMTPYLPIGGVGNSGMGKYHGKAGFDLFSNLKSVMKRNSGIDNQVTYPPYHDKLEWLKRLLK